MSGDESHPRHARCLRDGNKPGVPQAKARPRPTRGLQHARAIRAMEAEVRAQPRSRTRSYRQADHAQVRSCAIRVQRWRRIGHAARRSVDRTADGGRAVTGTRLISPKRRADRSPRGHPGGPSAAAYPARSCPGSAPITGDGYLSMAVGCFAFGIRSGSLRLPCGCDRSSGGIPVSSGRRPSKGEIVPHGRAPGQD